MLTPREELELALVQLLCNCGYTDTEANNLCIRINATQIARLLDLLTTLMAEGGAK